MKKFARLRKIMAVLASAAVFSAPLVGGATPAQAGPRTNRPIVIINTEGPWAM